MCVNYCIDCHRDKRSQLGDFSEEREIWRTITRGRHRSLLLPRRSTRTQLRELRTPSIKTTATSRSPTTTEHLVLLLLSRSKLIEADRSEDVPSQRQKKGQIIFWDQICARVGFFRGLALSLKLINQSNTSLAHTARARRRRQGRTAHAAIRRRRERRATQRAACSASQRNLRATRPVQSEITRMEGVKVSEPRGGFFYVRGIAVVQRPQGRVDSQAHAPPPPWGSPTNTTRNRRWRTDPD